MLKNLSIILLVLFLSLACTDDEPEFIGLNEEEAAEQVASLLVSEVDGVLGDVRVLSASAKVKFGVGRVAQQECGTLYDTLITFDYIGPNVEFDINFEYDYGLNCNNRIPQDLEVTFATASTYSGVRVMREGAANGSIVAGGLPIADTEYEINGSLTSASEITQQQNDQDTFSGQSEVTLSNVVVTKGTNEIQRGTATVSTSGTSPSGETYFFQASVEYLGNGIAIVTINEQSFSIDLSTGEVTPR